MGDSKEEFFGAIGEFRNSTISQLRKTKIINQDALNELDKLLGNIATMKSKGGDKVYWSRVKPEYDKAKLTLNEMILGMDRTKVPLLIRCKDFLKELFTEKSVIVIILGAVIFLIGLLINHLISVFKSLFN